MGRWSGWTGYDSWRITLSLTRGEVRERDPGTGPGILGREPGAPQAREGRRGQRQRGRLPGKPEAEIWAEPSSGSRERWWQ